jgi:hypothetical protein
MRLPVRLAVLPLALLVAGCSKVTALDGASRGTLSDTERQDVRRQSDQARAKREWGAAWEQEVEAGQDRARLEAIALDAIADDSGSGRDMLVEIRTKWGGLSEGSRARAASLVATAEKERRWSDAVQIALDTAADPPTFAAAWEVYRRAPADEAPDVLKEIQDARKEWSEAKDDGAPR